jgi:ferrous iron transport protein B
MTERKGLLVALAGQQNAGKSTLFNVLTGARQHVANYPGVTVDKEHGQYGDDLGIVYTVDLPGTCSLTSFLLEERVAREFLLGERPDVTVDVLDAPNLRRSLHLTVQLLEMGPAVLVLNMMDMAEARGIRIDQAALSRRLDLPVVATVGRKGQGREELRAAVPTAAERPAASQARVDYGPLEAAISGLEARLAEEADLADLPRRWLALALLQGDSQTVQMLVGRIGQERDDRTLLPEELIEDDDGHWNGQAQASQSGPGQHVGSLSQLSGTHQER